MPFLYLPNGPVQLSPGTHGIYDDSNCETLIGKVVVTLLEEPLEKWVWQDTKKFQDTFYMEPTLPNGEVTGTTVTYTYAHAAVKRYTSAINPDPTAPNMKVWKINRGDSTIGYLAKDGSDKLFWYIKFGQVFHGCIGGYDVLTFTKITEKPTAEKFHFLEAPKK